MVQKKLQDRKDRLKVIRSWEKQNTAEKVAARLSHAIETLPLRVRTGKNEQGYKLSIADIADELGCTRQQLHRWTLHGDLPAKYVFHLSRILMVGDRYLMFGEEAKRGAAYLDTISPEDSHLLRIQSISSSEKEDEFISETVITIPVKKLDVLAKDYGVQSQTRSGLSYDDLIYGLTTKDFNVSYTMTTTVKNPDHARVPTFGFLMNTQKFQDHIPRGAECFMTHRVLPRWGDFAAYLIKVDESYQIVMGFVSFVGADSSAEGSYYPDDHAYNHLAKLPVRLGQHQKKESAGDIVIPGSTYNLKTKKWNYARRYLGTLVKYSKWLHLTSELEQTDMRSSAATYDAMLGRASPSTSVGKQIDLSPNDLKM